MDTQTLSRAVRILHMNKRAKEEVSNVKEDMIRIANFYSAEHMLLSTIYIGYTHCHSSLSHIVTLQLN